MSEDIHFLLMVRAYWRLYAILAENMTSSTFKITNVIYFCFFISNIFSTMGFNFKTEYDFVIVGSGSAGSTVASRLSEEKSLKILLLEAGYEPPAISEVPFDPSLMLNTDIDWKYFTEPQENACLGNIKRRSYWPRGKVLGGSSILNSMMHVRGNKNDFDLWEKRGCKGWSYKDVLPYFMKSEDCRIPEIANNGYHGSEGSLTVSWAKYETKLKDALFEVLEFMGYKHVDYNAEKQTGYAKVQFVIRDGRRCSTEKAFLQTARGRPNLNIVTGAFVTKIEFDSDKRAKFVVFEHNNNTYKVTAEKEVIISGGAINSPQLLLLSGIGPKDHLQEFGIPVIVDLPGVGNNLHDHVGTYAAAFRTQTPFGFEEVKENFEKFVQNFDESASGPISVPSAIEAVGFLNTKFADKRIDFPDIQLALVSLTYALGSDNYNDELKNILNKYCDGYGFMLFPILQRPKSRGFLKLRSSNPHDHPIINPRYLTDEEDVAVLADGLRIMKEISDSKPFKDLGAEAIFSALPGCQEYESWSEDFRKCAVKTLTTTVYHHVGTCKMGDVNDVNTVVDSKLRVKGVKGLRVIDGSIMPSVVSANTNAAIIMIGEKGADLIKETLK